MSNIKPLPKSNTVRIAPIRAPGVTPVNKVDRVIIDDTPLYIGDYEVTPSTSTEKVLNTKNLKMSDDVKVKKIPFFQTSNESGTTVYIGSEV